MQAVKIQFHIADREYYFLPEFSQVPDFKVSDLKAGDAVTFETEDSDKGLRAVNVTLA